MAMRAAALLFLCVCAVALSYSSGASASTRNIVQTVHGPSRSKWSVCAHKTYVVQIEDVVISPDPVVAGNLVTFTIPAYASEELTGGTVVVTVILLGIKVHTEKDDLCSKSKCPISGEFTLNSEQEMPSFTPPGSYKLRFQVLDSDGKELTCVSVSFSIVWRSQFEQLIDATSDLQKKLLNTLM